MKYIFIVNKNAGKGKSKKIIPNINKVCKKENINFEIRYISKEKSGYDIALEYKDEENIIYVVGGDGTLGITLPGIIGTKNKLGIIPTGSGNDTYRTIKTMPEGENLIDIGKINNKYFINVACSGIDAEVGNNIEKLRNTIIPTSQLYNASLIYTFISFRHKKMNMRTKIKNIEDKYTILSICNGIYYGGGYKIAPKSRLTDGLLDVYYAEKMSKLKMLPLILKLKKGKHEGRRRVHKFRTNHVELEINEEVIFNVDGEKLTGKKFIIDVLPKAITIFNENDFVEEIMK
jgi:YegS/Rv2252/BmrU family lipid kinase